MTPRHEIGVVSDFVAGAARQVIVAGHPVCVVRTGDGQLHAIDDTCTHADVSLAEGDVEGHTIECWLHGSRFSLDTGQPTGLPATVPVAVHDIEIDGERVLVALKEKTP